MPTLTFKVSLDEAARIRLLARRRNKSLSEYVRQRALGEEAAPEAVRRVRCEHTGAMIFEAPAGSRPLTTEAVAELLADFP